MYSTMHGMRYEVGDDCDFWLNTYVKDLIEKEVEGAEDITEDDFLKLSPEERFRINNELFERIREDMEYDECRDNPERYYEVSR